MGHAQREGGRGNSQYCKNKRKIYKEQNGHVVYNYQFYTRLAGEM